MHPFVSNPAQSVFDEGYTDQLAFWHQSSSFTHPPHKLNLYTQNWEEVTAAQLACREAVKVSICLFICVCVRVSVIVLSF